MTELRFPKPARRAAKPRKRIRSQRRSSIAALKRKLWREFAAYVKARDGNVCFSCGQRDLSSHGWHAGHMFPAGTHALIRYEPKNVHSQCYRCNINLGGNGAAYAERFIARYGMAEFARLSSLSQRMKAWRAPEVVELIEALRRGGAEYESLYAERYGL